jgi:hypothetical protein
MRIYLTFFTCILLSLSSNVYSGPITKQTVVSYVKNLSFNRNSTATFHLSNPDRLFSHINHNKLIQRVLKRSYKIKEKGTEINWNADNFQVHFRLWLVFKNEYIFLRRELHSGDELVFEIFSKQSILNRWLRFPSSASSSIRSLVTVKALRSNNSIEVQLKALSASTGLSQTELDKLIQLLKDLISTELKREAEVMVAREREHSQFSEETAATIKAIKMKNLDKVINPDKYSKPKGRPAPGGGGGNGRFIPSAATQARRTINKGG